MMKLNFVKNIKSSMTVLCLGAHCDDIEIGCGGTILRLIKETVNLKICWIVLSSDKERSLEARKSANLFLRNTKDKIIEIENFQNSYFPYHGKIIKEYFETLKSRITPDIVFTHFRNDLHQDHKLVSELTWNTFRDNLIFEYEIIKYDGDLGQPNVFTHLNKLTCQKKIAYIMNCYTSQSEKAWFDEKSFLAILRIRGVESNAHTGYAEGFYCRKLIF